MSACWLHLSQWIKKKLPKVSPIKCSKVLMWLSLWCFLLRTPSWSSWPPVRLLLYDSVCRTSEVAKMCYRFEWLCARRAEEVTLLFPLQTFLLSCLLVCAAGPVGTSCFVSRGVKCGLPHLIGWFSPVPGVTGVLLVLILFLMFTSSSSCVR